MASLANIALGSFGIAFGLGISRCPDQSQKSMSSMRRLLIELTDWCRICTATVMGGCRTFASMIRRPTTGAVINIWSTRSYPM